MRKATSSARDARARSIRAFSARARRPGRGGTPAPASDGEAGADEGAVVAVERRDVGDGADGHEVEEGAEVELGAERAAHRGAEREGEAARGHALVGEAALGPVRVEEGERGQRLGRDEVVIDDHRVDPRARAPRRAARDRSSRSRT